MLSTPEAKELLELAEAQRDYIMALPNEVVDKLPAMPGFDGDWAEETIFKAKEALEKK